ncbi:uncharacterized protein LOC110726144 [Chenopodium quinoa]|uniref:uncharacterized protein LOC110726144 n=1 Tax=Chenopodium quinoa TaxID=63459 RepID=UPI000B790D2F|nr:uncharacterized protein LOC110726144 [Chenopodium quinoa]
MAGETNKSQDPTQNPVSPYNIHPNDSLKMTSVTVKFDGTSYGDWKCAMMIGLTAKNKLAFVDGSITVPIPEDVCYNAWRRCNDLVISWILSSLDPVLARSVLYFTTAREIWKNLEERYAQSSGSQLFAIQQQLSDLPQANQSIAEYFTKMKMLWDELDGMSPLPVCSCAGWTCNITQNLVKQREDQRLIQFLMKLNEQFTMARGNILMMQPLVPVNHAYRLLIQEERHKSIVHSLQPGVETHALMADTTSSIESCAFTAYRRNFDNRNYKNLNYGKMNFQFQDKNKGKFDNMRQSQFFCERCKIPGHAIDRCFKIHGYPRDFKQNTKRFANFAQGGDNNTDAEDVVTTSFTLDQYSKFKEFMEGQIVCGI